MSTVNKARVWCEVNSGYSALQIRYRLDRARVSPILQDKRPNGLRRVSFQVPTGMNVQEAILLLSRLVPEGTEVYAS